MDEARRFRFLVPPFFLILSLSVGLYFSGFDFTDLPNKYSTEQLVAFGAIVGASVLPLGFLLTSVSILGLRAVGLLAGCRTYEAVMPAASWNRMWPLLKTSLPLNSRWHLYAAATFDHELFSPGIHDWIQRRWGTFNVSVHSFAAVAVSHLAALLPGVTETRGWILVSAPLLLVFAATALIAWLQTMRMLEFQASRETDVFRSPANTPLQPTASGGGADQ